MQAILPNLPTPTVQTVAYGMLMFIAGLTVPTRYGIERLEGFGRAMASKLPYKSPPGIDKETAMQEATGETENSKP